MESAQNFQRARVRRAVSEAFRAHLPSFLLLAALFVAARIFLDKNDARFTPDFGLMAGELLRLFPLFLGAAGLLALVWSIRKRLRGRRSERMKRRIAAGTWLEVFLLRIPLMIGLALATSYLYFTFKVNITNFAPFSWDHFFAGVDRALFLGHDPWVLSHRLFPGVTATRIFDALYLIWYLILFAAIFSVAAMPSRHPLRMSFLLALGLNWIIAGVILPILLPAAGPVYLERITGDPTFQPLMELLYRQDEITRIMALGIQEWLWAGYTRADIHPAGISAFPSVHVSIAATCACLGFAASRVLGWLVTMITAGILVGSVHLGWHYAIDGIAGIVLAIAFWRISTRIARWWLARTEPERAKARSDFPVAAK